MTMFRRPFHHAVNKSCKINEVACHDVTRKCPSGPVFSHDQFSEFARQRVYESTT